MVKPGLLVGRAFWTDPNLIKCKCFYPDDVKTLEERLRFYASRFSVMEWTVASTAAALNNSVLWNQRTQPNSSST